MPIEAFPHVTNTAMIFSLLVFPLIFAWAYRKVDARHQGATE